MGKRVVLLPLFSFSRNKTGMTDLGVKDGKTNRTFAKNILVFVPLKTNNVSLD